MRFLSITIRALALAAIALAIAVWIVGAVWSDRSRLTQYLSWIPPFAITLTVPLFMAVFLAASRKAKWLETRPRRRGSLLLLASCVPLLLTLAVTYRAYRYLLPRDDALATGLRVMHWNINGQHPALWGDLVLEVPKTEDIFLFTNVHRGWRFRELQEHLGSSIVVKRSSHLAVASRFPIIEHSGARLNLPRPEAFPDASVTSAGPPIEPRVPPPRTPNLPAWYDPGYIMSATLDTTDVIGRPLVVWIIDLPSDIRLHRRRVSEFVAHRIDELHEEGKLPAPDLIAGDFNMPRGSGSMRLLVDRAGALQRPLHHAYADGGRGLAATYPSETPLLHLDHIFIREDLRAVRYEIVPLTGSSHLAQRAILNAPSIDER